jgi:tyrosine-protein kinase
VVGLLLAMMLSLFFEWISNRATSVEQIQELLDVEIMTLVPRIPRKARLSETWQATVEKYHMICASLNVAQASKPFKLVMFTSALAGEGKSTIISQVAMSLAQTGKQVLLIDLNIHRPALEQQFRLPSQVGLTNLLTRKSTRLHIEQYSQASEVLGLRVLTAGTQRMNSAEFLQTLAATRFFALLKQTAFDYILFDAPPLFAVADTQILLPMLEAVVLVVNGAHTPRRVLARTRQVLWRLQTTRVLGVIVNQSAWRDYADTHPYALPQPKLQKKGRFSLEPITTDLPAQVTQVLPASKLVGDLRSARLPDTGEYEPVIPVEAPSYVIRPMLSLNGRNMSSNGLTRRAFDMDVVMTPLPQSLQDS